MQITALLLAAAGLATALPTNYTTPQEELPTNFLLLTTTSSEALQNSSLLPSVSATSLYDPLAATNYLLRLIGPGYNSLPRFNLTDGTLETEARGPHGIGEFEYNSTRVRAGEELNFAPETQPKGNLGLADGFLLTVSGQSEGWKVCDGDNGQQVVSIFCFRCLSWGTWLLELLLTMLICRLLGRAMIPAAPTRSCTLCRRRLTEMPQFSLE